ncbi:MAG: hypothetical protein ACO1SV_05960 [Fimbriimonas sp.]
MRLIDERSIVTAEMLRREVGKGPLLACDFHVVDIEAGDRVPGGFLREGILNVDHHAPVREMERAVSSTNLAIERVRADGPAGEDAEVVAHHMDCDSVLSSTICRGILPADDRFGAAAIAADHTGMEDPIADLLQAVQGYRDMRFSLASLSRLLDGAPLGAKAQEGLDRRRRERDDARKLVRSGELKVQDGLAWARYDHALDTALLPGLVPEAKLLMITRKTRTGKWIMKLRLGLAAPPGVSLHRIGLHEFDRDFGGRWNAGSNRRAGGTTISPAWYVRELRKRMPRLDG